MTGWVGYVPETDGLWFYCHQERYFLFSKASRPDLRPAQTSIQQSTHPRERGRWVNIITHLRVVLRLRTNGAIPPLPHMPA